MADRYLACDEADLDEQTGECSAAVWVTPPDIFADMPSVEDAGLIGGTMLVAVVTIRALILLFKPPKEIA